jgi:arsenate reductase
VCDHANEHCPVFPNKAKKVHQNFPDPAKIQGTDEEIISAFCQVRDMIKVYCNQFVNQYINK